MVCDKVACERWCGERWGVKDGVRKMVCDKDGVSEMVRDKVVCERWCERWCVKDGG